MTHSRVDSILHGYRFDVGRCGHLALEIKELEQKYTVEKTDMLHALASPKPQQLTDMPRGTAIGKSTEKIGLMLASGYATEEMQDIHIKISAKTDEYNERKARVLYVQGWLTGLTERERWMVETQVIDGVFWKDVGVQYASKFGEAVSKDTLKRLRDRAMDKVYAMAE